MKRLIITLLATSLVLAAVSLAMGEVRINTDDRMPFEGVDGDGNLVGVSTEVVVCAMDAVGMEYSIETLPWKRAQQEVKDGDADAFYSASRNDARDEYAVLSEVVADQYWNWYLLADNALDPAADDFKANASTGSWYGSNSLKWLNENGYNVVADPATPDVLVTQLLAGRVDAIFGSNFAIEEAIEAAGATDTVRIVQNLHKPMGVYFGKTFLDANPGFLDQFNAKVLECRP